MAAAGEDCMTKLLPRARPKQPDETGFSQAPELGTGDTRGVFADRMGPILEVTEDVSV